jgi:hypothetical protein
MSPRISYKALQRRLDGMPMLKLFVPFAAGVALAAGWSLPMWLVVTIVLMGGVYAGGVAGLDFLKKNYALIKGKRILLFAVGASPYDEKAFTEGVRRCLKGDLAGLPCFYGRGMWDLESMHFGDRTLCKMLLKATAKQDPSTFEPWQAALAAMKPGETADWTDKAYLEPLLAALC